MSRRRIVCLGSLVTVLTILLAGGPSVCWAQNRITYTLLDGSTLTDDCPVCGRPTIIVPIKGTFVLALREQNPLFTTYEVQELRFSAFNGAPEYEVTGGGTYEIGGEVAVVQRMSLKVQIGQVPGIDLKSGDVPPGQPWPKIEIDVTQEPVNPLQTFSIHIIGSPVQVARSYMLLDGSTLTDDCTICDRRPIIVPMRGTFSLSLRETNPLFTVYDLRDINFDASNGILEYLVKGEGTYEIGGEVALMQRMQLKVQIDGVLGVELKSDYGPPQRVWPMIEIDVGEGVEPPRNPLQVFYMHIVAAPVREIWFSTRTSFTSGTLGERMSAGDLLSHTGRIVKTNSDLTRNLGIMPMVPDLGLDAVDVGPGGEVFFSCDDYVFSQTLGPLQHGDLLSDKGRIVRTNQQLTSAFVPEPVASDVGLDAVQVKEDGEILFSIEQDLFSEALDVMLRPGDLLSNKGVIVRTNKELLAKFEPTDVQDDLGLDAIHVWPSGEIWFSTESGFQSKTLGAVSEGDLLSDNGTIVFRNLELLQRFRPLEKLANFGLDGLFLITDGEPKEPPTPKATITLWQESGDVRIDWTSDGKVFQLERADEPGGPYVAVGPITTDTEYVDLVGVLGTAKSFYRLRLW